MNMGTLGCSYAPPFQGTAPGNTGSEKVWSWPFFPLPQAAHEPTTTIFVVRHPTLRQKNVEPDRASFESEAVLHTASLWFHASLVDCILTRASKRPNVRNTSSTQGSKDLHGLSRLGFTSGD